MCKLKQELYHKQQSIYNQYNIHDPFAVDVYKEQSYVVKPFITHLFYHTVVDR